jgi:hypothetical protein
MNLSITSPLKLWMIWICSVYAFQSQAQPFEFGRLTQQEMNLEYYRELYPEEDAVMIGDIAQCGFVYNNTKRRFQFQFERTYRLMILTEQGTRLGNISIPYYATSTNSEEITRFQANVYHFDGRRVVRERVRQRDGFSEDLGNNWHQVNYALPNVRPGTVLEVNYTLVSDYIEQLRDWQFQYEFPVEYSEYTLRLLSLFQYRMYYRGFVELDVATTRHFRESFRIDRQVSSAGISHSVGSFNAAINASEHRWVARNVPAFQEEPFTDNIRNYLASMNFELIAETWPDEPPKNFTQSWEDVSRVAYEDKQFGGYLSAAYLEVYDRIRLDESSDYLKRVHTALDTIRNLVSWNGRSAMWTRQSPQEVLATGQGNAAEVNLLLLALLQNSGIEAQPVLLSTRSRGTLTYDSPTLFRFNYVLVAVITPDNEVMLLDATPLHLPPGLIPSRAVNGRGRMLGREDSRWVALENPGMYHLRKQYNLELTPEGTLSGTLTYHYHDIARHLVFSDIMDEGAERLLSRTGNRLQTELTQHTLSIPEARHEPIVLSARMEIPGFVPQMGPEVFLQPLLFETLQRNIFQQEERLYPVVFNYPLINEVEIRLQLPPGYQTGSIPRDNIIRWGNNTVYEYSTAAEENILIITAKEQIGVSRVKPAITAG